MKHILNCCDKYNFTLYLARHDEVLVNIHTLICNGYGLKPTGYRQTPSPVLENENVKILWDVCIPTADTIQARRPDIVVYLEHEKRVVIIDQSCPSDDRLAQSKAGKKSKYQALRVDFAK